jgi:hypothetical protein
MQSATLKMKSESGLSERRFGIIFMLFKLAGIPLDTHSESRLKSVYNITSAVFFYLVCVSCFMDIYVNRINLQELMRSIRVCISFIIVMVIDISFRYVKLNQPAELYANQL